MTEALDNEDPKRFLESEPQAELSLSAAGKKPFSAKVKLSLKENGSAVSSWNDLLDLLYLEAELEGNVPGSLEKLGLKAGGEPLKITYDKGQLSINGEAK